MGKKKPKKEPKPTPQETLERIARCVCVDIEEAADEYYEFDRETLLGILSDVRWALSDAGVDYGRNDYTEEEIDAYIKKGLVD